MTHRTALATLAIVAVLACGCSRRSRVSPQPTSAAVSATAVQPTVNLSGSLSAASPTEAADEAADAAAVRPHPPASAPLSAADASLGSLESALDGLEEALAGMEDWEVEVP